MKFVANINSVIRGLLRRWQRIAIDSPQRLRVDDHDPVQQFSIAWFNRLYQELGDGTRCYRPDNTPDYGGGFLKACLCCRSNTNLHLLPREENLFRDVINETDFKLVDHPSFSNRKTIVCSKLGMCDGRKPFVCRTAPVYFVNGLMLYEESLCRLTAITYLNFHRQSVEHIRAVVYKYALQDATLGYGRNVSTASGPVHRDFEH